MDDDATVLIVLQAMLQHLGYGVLLASDAAECFAQFQAHKAQIALTVIDVHLGHANGHQVLAQLREQCPTLPAIISSGFSEELAFTETTRDALTEFVQKPYETAVLARRIRAMLDAGALAPTPPRHWAAPDDGAA